jgi:hypothetical protein
MLWPLIFERGQEIGFAHLPFKWTNNASKNAAVTCIIVGIRPNSKDAKFIYGLESSRIVTNISPYLIEADNSIVYKRSKPLSSLPKCDYGNKPTDNGGFVLDPQTADAILAEGIAPKVIVRSMLGSKEFIYNAPRQCLWISDSELEDALKSPIVEERIEHVRSFRSASVGDQAQKGAAYPHRFVFAPHRDGQSIIIPRHSSEKRLYLPIGLISDNSIINDSASAIYDAPTWLFGLISSRLHLLWTASVGGRIKTDYRYSNTLVYNTFPSPSFSSGQKQVLEERALQILRVREPYIVDGRTIAWLYNPETMPADLLGAHRELDDYLETIYIGRPFRDDAERLEHLFKLYARMTKTAAKAA